MSQNVSGASGGAKWKKLFAAGLLSLFILNFPWVAVAASFIPPGKGPVASFTYSPMPAVAGQSVVFDATDSYALTGSIVAYEWDFTGDGRPDAFGVTAVWAFAEPGTYAVTLTVVDDRNTVAKSRQHVRVDGLGVGRLEARFTYWPLQPRVGQLVTFDARSTVGGGVGMSGGNGPGGSGGSDIGGAGGKSNLLTYEWDLTGDGRFDTFGPVVTRRFERNGAYQVTLRVRDDFGRMSQAKQVIHVGRQVGQRLVRVVIESEPSGVTVYVDGIERGRTPLTLDLQPRRHRLQLKHYWRGEWETELDLTSLVELSLRVVLR